MTEQVPVSPQARREVSRRAQCFRGRKRLRTSAGDGWGLCRQDCQHFPRSWGIKELDGPGEPHRGSPEGPQQAGAGKKMQVRMSAGDNSLTYHINEHLLRAYLLCAKVCSTSELTLFWGVGSQEAINTTREY